MEGCAGVVGEGGLHCMPCSSRIIREMAPHSCTIEIVEFSNVVFSTLAELHLSDITWASI